MENENVKSEAQITAAKSSNQRQIALNNVKIQTDFEIQTLLPSIQHSKLRFAGKKKYIVFTEVSYCYGSFFVPQKTVFKISKTSKFQLTHLNFWEKRSESTKEITVSISDLCHTF